jgi:hypothetical protein
MYYLLLAIWIADQPLIEDGVARHSHYIDGQ